MKMNKRRNRVAGEVILQLCDKIEELQEIASLVKLTYAQKRAIIAARRLADFHISLTKSQRGD